jgi:hypothetical protein
MHTGADYFTSDGDTDDNLAIVSSKSEQEALDNLADLYAIIITTEHLERAYARDAISHNEVELKHYILQSIY